jgi:hypothetical protein
MRYFFCDPCFARNLPILITPAVAGRVRRVLAKEGGDALPTLRSVAIATPKVDCAIVLYCHAMEVQAEVGIVSVANVLAPQDPHLADVVIHFPQIDLGAIIVTVAMKVDAEVGIISMADPEHHLIIPPLDRLEEPALRDMSVVLPKVDLGAVLMSIAMEVDGVAVVSSEAELGAPAVTSHGTWALPLLGVMAVAGPEVDDGAVLLLRAMDVDAEVVVSRVDEIAALDPPDLRFMAVLLPEIDLGAIFVIVAMEVDDEPWIGGIVNPEAITSTLHREDHPALGLVAVLLPQVDDGTVLLVRTMEVEAELPIGMSPGDRASTLTRVC